jgi:APA family basic amino acid/polyamine antiporter
MQPLRFFRQCIEYFLSGVGHQRSACSRHRTGCDLVSDMGKYTGIIATGKLQLVTTILKIIPLVSIAIGGLFFLNVKNFLPFNSTGVSDYSAILTSGAYTFFAFLGIECATVPSCSVANPEKTIARATMLGMLLTTFIYIISCVSIMGMIPGKDLQHSLTPYADAAVIIWGSSARYWVSAGVAIAAFGALNGWILIQGQMPYAIAKDKLFPRVFGKLNQKGVPAMGIIISSVLISLLMSMNYTKGLVEQFKFLIMLTTLTVLVPYLFSTAAYMIIRMEKKYLKPGGWVSSIILASLSFLFCIWAVAGSGQEIVYWGFLLILAGLPFYVIIRWNKKP